MSKDKINAYQTADLRFVERNGQKILQQGYRLRRKVIDVEIETGYEWRDVPLEKE